MARRRSSFRGYGSRRQFRPAKPRPGKRKGAVAAETVEMVEPTEDTPVVLQPLQLPAALNIKQLADRMRANPIEVIKQLMRRDIMANINQVVDFATASHVAMAFGYKAIVSDNGGVEPAIPKTVSSDEDPSDSISRSPVVTILGHVDHGKTTLLDSIRRTSVVDTEAGGITQHIGAYQVQSGESTITFLDTPGHHAFTAMRARGARVTDIVVLVVAADDGIMPQTIEAISHAKAAEVPIVVAINKMDKPGVDVEKVQRQLTEHDLVIEEWGGNIITVPVSATNGDGISSLLETILLVAEVADLKADPKSMAVGVVIEARIDKSKGPLATILVQNGTLQVGDNIVVGGCHGRIKAMMDHSGRRMKEAGPSTPVQLFGLSGQPQGGDILVVVPDERTARETVEERRRAMDTGAGQAMTLEHAASQIQAGSAKDFNLIIKTDVQGSVEAVCSTLANVGTDEVNVNIIHASSGSITENDVLLAVASQAIVVGFNCRPEPGARRLADVEGVDVRYYNVIYELAQDIEAALEGVLEKGATDIDEGRAEVRQVFAVGRRNKVAGCYITEGRLMRSAKVRVLRGGEEIADVPVGSLKRFKDDVREVSAGYECGLTLDGFADFQEGDILQIHRQESAEKAR